MQLFPPMGDHLPKSSSFVPKIKEKYSIFQSMPEFFGGFRFLSDIEGRVEHRVTAVTIVKQCGEEDLERALKLRLLSAITVHINNGY